MHCNLRAESTGARRSPTTDLADGLGSAVLACIRGLSEQQTKVLG